ncbi:DNA polymerase III alpha subunit [Burkholderia phage Maja]|uniref:DNA polymerase III alpha subunit n=1 Tax=Burkholderia phage Maja TaxID=2767571 RepID=A0A7S6R885_9CAUD|nr:DNA polymerase III alpha subunit [Burkholderia phage Maja]
MSLPQLRVRTGYSFKKAYGHLDDIAARLGEVGVPFAGIVDASTWGHVRFDKAIRKANITPGFGVEIPIGTGNAETEQFKPRAWILAKDTRRMYNASTRAAQNGSLTPSQFSNLSGVFRFSGGALDALLDSYSACAEHEPFDYIDLNPSSIAHAANGVRWHRRSGIPLVLTSYNDMPRASDANFAWAWEVRDSVGMRHIATIDDMWSQLRYVMTREEFEVAIENTHAVADALKGVELQKAPIISLEGDMLAWCREGQAERLAKGHIKEWTKEYEDRLLMEVEQIRFKKFDSYFLCVADLVRFAKRHMLVGPARGSSAGSLVCYLMGITEVDPLPYGLLFQRFIDVSRSDFPDIDIDFNDDKREMVFDYLREKYGSDCVARVGNVSTVKAASAIAQVSKKFGIGYTENDIIKNALVSYAKGDDRYGYELADTFEQTEPGRDYAERHPGAAAMMAEIEIHPSHTSVHAAGILVCNDPVSDFCTVEANGVASIDKDDAEALNLLKIDALGLRTLGIIESANVMTPDELYALTPTDQRVFDVLNEGKVLAIFQFEGNAVRQVTKRVHIDRFSKIDNITSLARPGPLGAGMDEPYIKRTAGKEAVTFAFPELRKYLGDTFGILLYQEQIMAIVREIGGFDWPRVTEIRKAMGKSKGAEYFDKHGDDFVAGAVERGINADAARKLWKEMVTFGAYGFNKSHSVAYSIVTYWTLYLKRFHRLEFAAACLRSAKDEQQTIAILRELVQEGVQYTAIDPEYSAENWLVADGRLIGGIMNAKGYGPSKAQKYIELRNNRNNSEKDRKAFEKAAAKLAEAEVPYADLNEAHTKFGAAYRDSSVLGVESGKPITNIKAAIGGEIMLFIGKLKEKRLGDFNDPKELKRSGKKPRSGCTQYLDMFFTDDSVDSPVKFRIADYENFRNPVRSFSTFGRIHAEADNKGKWFLIKAKKWEGFESFQVLNLKQISE